MPVGSRASRPGPDRAMETNVAREFHHRTKHHPGIADVPRRVDAGLVPRQYKRYLGLPAIDLALPSPSSRTFFETLEGSEAASRRPSSADLAAVLHYSAGIVRRRNVGGRELAFRAASCTGALYHIEAYVVCGDVDHQLAAGVYHFDVPANALRRLRGGDHRRTLAEACCDDRLASRAASVVLTSTFWRNAWRYQERAYRHVFWDAGTLLANLLAVGEGRGLRPALLTGFVDSEVNELLGVDGRREAAVAVVGLGAGEVVVERAPITPLRLETERLSRAEIEYPAIWRTHEAGSMAGCEEVRAWRGGANGRGQWAELSGSAPLNQGTMEPENQAGGAEDMGQGVGVFGPAPLNQGTREPKSKAGGAEDLGQWGELPDQAPLNQGTMEPRNQVGGGDALRQWAGLFGPAPLNQGTREPWNQGGSESAAGAWGVRARGGEIEGAPLGVLGLEDAIARRVSARRFGDVDVSREAAGAVVSAAQAGVEGDVPAVDGLVRTLLIVNRVEGVEPGVYGVDGEGKVSLVRAGNFAGEAAHLALDQPAAGRAAVNVYFVASLREVSTLGERGYRAVQLEAGVRTGRVYLAAASLGLRATGLTFYDDEVARFFGLDSEDTLVLMAVVFGA